MLAGRKTIIAFAGMMLAIAGVASLPAQITNEQPVLASGPTPTVKYRQGLHEYNQQDYPAAVDSLTWVINSNCEPALQNEARYWRGMSYFALRNFVAAVVDYDNLLRDAQDPQKIATLQRFRKYASHSTEFVHALFARGEFDLARSICRENVRTSGSKPNVAAESQYLIAESYAIQNRQEEALREFLRVDVLYESEPWQAASLFRAAECYEQLHRPAPAKATYARVVREYSRSEHATAASTQLAKLTRQHGTPHRDSTSGSFTSSLSSFKSFKGAVAALVSNRRSFEKTESNAQRQ